MICMRLGSLAEISPNITLSSPSPRRPRDIDAYCEKCDEINLLRSYNHG